MKRFFAAAMAAVVVLAAASAPGATDDSLRALVSQGEYGKAVAEADRILHSEGDALSDAQICAIQMTKAEALLQSKRIPQAAAAFGAALRIAPDRETQVTARASQALLGRVVGTSYTPKGGSSRQPIDVLDADSRKRAMAALAADLAPQATRGAQTAITGTTLGAVESAFVPLLDLYAIQSASGEGADATAKTLQALADHLHQLLADELRTLSRRVHQSDRAAMMSDNYSPSGRRGLNSRERDDLRNLRGYVNKVAGRVQLYRQTAQRMVGQSARWDSLLAGYSALGSEIDFILDAANS